MKHPPPTFVTTNPVPPKNGLSTKRWTHCDPPPLTVLSDASAPGCDARQHGQESERFGENTVKGWLFHALDLYLKWLKTLDLRGLPETLKY